MDNFDNFNNKENELDETVHRSRVAKKEREQLALEEEVRARQALSDERRAQKAKKAPLSKLDFGKKSEKTEKKERKQVAAAAETAKIQTSDISAEISGEDMPRAKKKNKKKFGWKQAIKLAICLCLVVALAVIGWVFSIIHNASPIETSDINSLLSQSSILYDDQGEVIDNIFSEQNRTLVEIAEVPEYVKYAFISLEDKTFETHHGFNIIRIFGAIKDAIFSGGGVSGTSTITQQLARNLYLADTMQERSLNRKIKEAYYAVLLERALSKDEIMEAYLNTVNFGMGCGIQTASQAYFSKDVQDLTVAEAAALAAMPQAPTLYALVKTVDMDSVTEDTENLITISGNYAYVWNDKAASRMKLCLKLMLNQGHITQEQYDEAVVVEIKDMVNPNLDTVDAVSNYFADYVISKVISDLQDQYDYDSDQAKNLVYNGGLKIYTTLDSQAQAVIEKEFSKNSNFPNPTGYKKDVHGNILKENGDVLLYRYENYIEDDTTFRFKSSEYEWQADGSLVLKFGNRVAFYATEVNGKTDYSLEFRPMYKIEGDNFYSIPGGYINIPQEYKTKDSSNNIHISAQFFTDYPSFFVQDGDKLAITNFTLRQQVIEPQAAMTIIDNETGAIKAMIGGRGTEGRMLFNRATSTRQPGSSIKPVAVYSAALQKSYECAAEDKTFPLVETGVDTQGTNLWGDYVTAGSIVDDEPLSVAIKEGGAKTKWPKNSYSGYKGLYTLRTALQQSVNTCAVKILSQVTVEYAYEHAKSFGLTTLVGEGDQNDVNLAGLALGGLTNGVSTLEMASAYTTFVNDGMHKSYYCYDKVTTRTGDVLLEPVKSEDEVLNPGVAWIMRNILQTVVSEGIGSPARVSGQNVGGKTGTTSDSYDIWFDGFTANYTASLWIGNDVNIKLSSMSNKAAALWSKIIGQCDGALGGEYSKRPDNVISKKIDTQSGMLADENSQHTRTEYFTKGTEPIEKGSLTQTADVCWYSEYLATPACPKTEEISGVARPYKKNDAVKDKLKDIPVYYCPLHNPDPDFYEVDPEYDGEITIVEIPEDTGEEDEQEQSEPVVLEPGFDPDGDPLDVDLSEDYEEE